MFVNDRFKEGLRASQKNKLESILIGNNVNIGTNSTILPVKISDNVTIGAASLVLDDINLKGIYYGNPIKEKIRLFDLYKNNQVYKKEFLKKLNKIIVNSEFISGSYVREFEKSFARLNKVNYCQSCGNGTDAIFGSLKALDIGIGDEVLVSSHDWISSEAVIACGAKPIFLDTKKDSFLIDDNKIERHISNRTKAIIIVHIYGQVFNFDKILSLKKI